MTEKCLYLVSSSASREYVVDCIEALALPQGVIQHFRYRLRYIDDRLSHLLQSETDPLVRSLRNLSVAVVYMFQEQRGGVWAPADPEDPEGTRVPLRCGRLLRAFIDGDVAHFYFELTSYVNPAYKRLKSGAYRNLSRQKLKATVTFQRNHGKVAQPSFAHVGRELGIAAPSSQDAVAFQTFVDKGYRPAEWRTRSLGSSPIDVTYQIVFFRIAGLFCQRNGRFDEVRPLVMQVGGTVYSEYEIESGTTYHLKIHTHLPGRKLDELPGQGNASLTLDFDRKVIRPMSPNSYRLSSFYDLEYWSFVAGPGPGHSSINIRCEHNAEGPNRREFARREVLCPEILLRFSIIPKIIAEPRPGGSS